MLGTFLHFVNAENGWYQTSSRTLGPTTSPDAIAAGNRNTGLRLRGLARKTAAEIRHLQASLSVS